MKICVKSTNGHITLLLVYVDDIVLTGDDLTETQFVKHHLDNHFKIKDLGPLKFFVCLEVARSKQDSPLIKESML